MLHRKREPNANLFNGVGGRIEPGETPLQCILREVEEETGIKLPAARFAGIVTWPQPGKSDFMGEDREGMYAYVADLPSDHSPAEYSCKETPEGLLVWLSIAMVLDRFNNKVVDNIREFLPYMLRGDAPDEFFCQYQDGRLVAVTQSVLSWDVCGLAETLEVVST